MSSKLYRGGQVPSGPIEWQRVASVDSPLTDGESFPAARYSSLPGSERVGMASGRAGGQGQDAYQQAFREGQAAARQDLAGQIETMNGRLARTIEELTGLRRRFRQEAEEDVVALAIAIARRILHRELTVAPEALLGLVKAALEKLEAREVHRVRVSHQDAAMVQQYLEKMGLPRQVEIVGDPGVERGALIFDTSRGALDASTQTQLAEIERGFADLVRRAS